MLLGFEEEHVHKVERNPVPPDVDFYVIYGDVSASNILINLDAIYGNGKIVSVIKAHYDGQKITDFNNQVLNHLLGVVGIREEQVKSIVLAPAGPISPDRRICDLTRAHFHVDCATIRIPTALINDFSAIAIAVATLGQSELSCIQLPHSDGNYGEAKDSQNIGIHGPGTGFGTSRLVYDSQAGFYQPLPSEGGHKFLAPDITDSTDVKIIKWLCRYTNGRKPHLEAIMSGSGIENVCEYFRNQLDDQEKLKYGRQLEAAEDRAAYIAEQAKRKPDSIFGKTMYYFFKHLGMALRDLAVHEIALGGVYIAGGITRKNIEMVPGSGELDTNIARIIMEEFDSGPSHSEWVNSIPIYVIMDPEVGLKGTLEVALNPDYFEKYVYKKS